VQSINGGLYGIGHFGDVITSHDLLSGSEVEIWVTCSINYFFVANVFLLLNSVFFNLLFYVFFLEVSPSSLAKAALYSSSLASM
jgi:hypothetical protein